MGAYICRQPNGLLCRYSTTIDDITDYNMTEEEYINDYVLRKMDEARKEAERRLRHLDDFEEMKEVWYNFKCVEEYDEENECYYDEPKINEENLKEFNKILKEMEKKD